MPYKWTPSDSGQTLTLWPHQSLPPRGFVVFIGVTIAMLTLPLLALLGSVLLWALLPFLALAVFGVWFAIHRNRQSARIVEVLTLEGNVARLTRTDPGGQVRDWQCNRYWVRVVLHPKGGPVPNYVTLSGNGREVEIGAFLSEDERLALHAELPGKVRGEP
ncbi:MAG: DUF2244 domain-containing protein [Pseudooceanicola sp.]|nr:DUF2244 domain-containing protein [Pseudooceanicola sp.]